jgi:hypothetical protein
VTQRQAARDHVLIELRRHVEERQRIVRIHPPGSTHERYRKEILRLWRLALRAVEREGEA